MAERKPTRSRNATDGALAAIINKWDTEDLIHAREEVDKITGSEGWDTIMHVISEGRANAQDRLVKGPVLDQAGYARAMGLLAGMDSVQEIANVIRALADNRERLVEKATDVAGKE